MPLSAKSTAVRAPGQKGVLFSLSVAGAKVVSVVGSFSEWEPVALSDEDRNGIWTTEIPLAPGRYEYAFIIDGRWLGQDPSADEYIRSFGEYSSVRYVGGGGDGA
jgi:1,4-alpha-glucan branching enzyme